MNLLLILIISYLIFCSYIDIKKGYIYFKPTIIILALIIILRFVEMITCHNNPVTFLSSFIPGILMILLSFLTRESIGYGDSILLLLCSVGVGLWNGIFIIMCSFIYSAIFSLTLLIKGKNKKETIPFVPFIFLALITYIFVL